MFSPCPFDTDIGKKNLHTLGHAGVASLYLRWATVFSALFYHLFCSHRQVAADRGGPAAEIEFAEPGKTTFGGADG